jgi:hypothetical protein
MSALENQLEETKEGDSLRRRPFSRGGRGRGRGRFGRGGRGGRGRGRGSDESNEEPRQPREIRAVSNVPVPTELIGHSSIGVVTAIIRRGRLKFGFISIGDGTRPTLEVPRVYFSFSHLKDTSLIIRKGYKVAFVLKNDDQERPYASEIELTEEGKTEAVEREAIIAQKRSENTGFRGETSTANVAAPSSDYKKKPRPIRPRKIPEPNVINLKVKCEGKTGEKIIPFDVTQSIGKLKSVAATEFEAPLTFNVYFVNDANPNGLFLTKSLLNSVTENDTILLAQPKDAEI